MIKATWALLCGLALVLGASRARAVDAWDSEAEWQLVQLTNQARAQHGLPPLHQDFRLQAAARTHTSLMALQKTLSHQLPGESVLVKRVELSGAYFDVIGETAAFNYTANAAQASFMHSPPHRRIILEPQYDAVGVGVVKHDGIVWMTEDFAHLQTEWMLTTAPESDPRFKSIPSGLTPTFARP